MASLDPVKSQLVIYNPQAHPLAKAKVIHSAWISL